MEENNDINNPNGVVDCKGTCKTPIGCTCGKKKKDDVSQDMIVLDVDSKQEVQEIIIQEQPIPEQPVGSDAGGMRLMKPKPVKCFREKKNTGCCAGTNKLEVYDWYSAIPQVDLDNRMVEVQFKNTRKGYYLNSNDLSITKGDIIAVEATPGHDIGEVTLTGKLVQLQMKKNNYRGEVKRIYRLAKPSDLEKAAEAKNKEHQTMLRAREMAEELDLNMKISDVEFQGDGNKAIFYYIADERVDFRQLIKVYASEFRVKIEMKQIGARQEAGRVGGIGPCGRELCCSSSMSNFVSVSTSAARLQEIPLNPQKLAGQCGKLKCCLNFEIDIYLEAQRSLPSRDIVLQTQDSDFFHFKTDILTGVMTYSTDKNFAANLVSLPKERVREIINLNRKGMKPSTLLDEEQAALVENPIEHDVLQQDSITRFDNRQRNRKGKNKKVESRNSDKKRQDEDGNNSKNLNLRNNRDTSNGNNGGQGKDIPRNTKTITPKRLELQQQGGEQQPQQQANTNNNRNARIRNKNNNKGNKPE